MERPRESCCHAEEVQLWLRRAGSDRIQEDSAGDWGGWKTPGSEQLDVKAGELSACPPDFGGFMSEAEVALPRGVGD